MLEIINEETSLTSILNNLLITFNEINKNEELKIILIENNIDNVVMIDSHRLNQILYNLIQNAIKFTTKGTIKFGYNIIDNEIYFFVKDTGIGISKDKQKIIFDRFTQADNSITRTYGGSGLGLSICSGLVRLMGGRIGVKSTENIGSEFYFNIPYKPIIIQSFTENNNNKIINIDLNNKVFLVVEDDDNSYFYLQELLENINGKVIRANNGKDAIQLCKNIVIDFVLMDINLPIMSGYTAILKIREFDKKIIIIAQTANASPENEKKLLNAGCNSFLSKPIRYNKLLNTLTKFL